MTGDAADPRQTVRRHPRRGMSLIEVMISSSILILGLSGLFSTLHTLFQAGRRAERVANGARVAHAFLDDLALDPLSTDARLTPGVHGPVVINDAGKADSAGPFSASWNVTAGVPTATTSRIDLRLTFADPVGDLLLSTFVRVP